MTGIAPALRLRSLGLCDYRPVWDGMRSFTDKRGPDTPDELWLLEHTPVYTLGQAGLIQHLLDPGDIPVVKVDRGGQVTYHGPGQLIAYLLLDLRRAGLGVKGLVHLLERSVVNLLAGYGVESVSRADAPGVYVRGAKIASLGLRVRRGCSFHGLALNVNIDLEPFTRINPCGHRGMEVTRLADLVGPTDMTIVSRLLAEQVAGLLNRTLVPAPRTPGGAP